MGFLDVLGNVAGLVVKGSGQILNEMAKSATGVDFQEEIAVYKENIEKTNGYLSYLEKNSKELIEEWGYEEYQNEREECIKQGELMRQIQQDRIRGQMEGKMNKECERMYGERVKTVSTHQLEYMLYSEDVPNPLKEVIYKELNRRR